MQAAELVIILAIIVAIVPYIADRYRAWRRLYNSMTEAERHNDWLEDQL